MRGAPAPGSSDGEAKDSGGGPESGEGQNRVGPRSSGGLQERVEGGKHDEADLQALVGAAVQVALPRAHLCAHTPHAASGTSTKASCLADWVLLYSCVC